MYKRQQSHTSTRKQSTITGNLQIYNFIILQPSWKLLQPVTKLEFPCFFFWCVTRLCLELYCIPHSSHLNMLPVWRRMCLFKLSLRSTRYAHMLHLNTLFDFSKGGINLSVKYGLWKAWEKGTRWWFICASGFTIGWPRAGNPGSRKDQDGNVVTE